MIRLAVLLLAALSVPLAAQAQHLGVPLVSTSALGVVSATYGYFQFISATSSNIVATDSTKVAKVGDTMTGSLHVAPSGVGRLALVGGGVTQPGYIQFATSDTTRRGYLGWANGSNLTFTTENGWGQSFITGGTERVRIDTSGNVGIGNIAPQNTLHVYNSTRGGNIGISQQNDSLPYMQMGMDSSYLQYLANNAYWTGSAYNYVNTGGYGGLASVIIQDSGMVRFLTASGGTNPITWSERVRVANNGNVGIGNTNPGYKLSVAGTIESTSGGIRYPDGTTQSTAFTGTGTDSTKVAKAGDTMTGNLVSNPTAANFPADGSAATSFEVRSATSMPATIAFHRPGVYAAYFGLGTDNNFRVGGWSMGGTSYKLWHEGNDGAGSGLDADTLDGLSSAAFIQAATGDTTKVAKTGDTMTGNLAINNTAPTITLQDSNQRSGFIHMNSNFMYFLSSNAANATGWTINGSYWPLTLNMTSDEATFGGNVTVPEGNINTNQICNASGANCVAQSALGGSGGSPGGTSSSVQINAAGSFGVVSDFTAGPAGWTTCTGAYSARGSSCYRVTTSMTRANAQTNCESDGGYLVKMNDTTERDAVAGITTGTVWSGLNDITVEGTWVWPDGTSASFTNWNGGEPNNGGGNEDCMEFNAATGMSWNDINCGNSRVGVCENPSAISSMSGNLVTAPAIRLVSPSGPAPVCTSSLGGQLVYFGSAGELREIRQCKRYCSSPDGYGGCTAYTWGWIGI